MPVPLAKLRPVVVRAARNRHMKRALVGLQRAQLALAVARWRRDPAIVAVLLRRPAVFVDESPGDNDYDLTCVFDPDVDVGGARTTVARWGRLHRRLKEVCPVLGETKLVDHRDLATHLRFDGPTYGTHGAPKVLFRRPDRGGDRPLPAALDAPVPVERHAVFFRIVEILRDGVWGDPAVVRPSANANVRANGSASSAHVNLMRNLSKLDWLAACARRAAPSDLRHDRERFRAPMSDADCRALVRRHVAEICALPPPDGEDLVALHVTPPAAVDDARDPTLPLRSALERILAPAIASGLFRAIALADYRPYQFNKTLSARLRSGLAPADEDAAWRLLADARPAIFALGVAVSPRHAVPFDAAAWELAGRADPVTRLLHDVAHFDLVARAWVRATSRRARVRRSALEQVVSEALTMLFSVTRRDDTNYLLDLLFGQLVAFRIALETGELHLSFDALWDAHGAALVRDAAQLRIVDAYRRGDLDAMARIPTLTAWDTFADVVSAEATKARAVLARAATP